MQPGTYTASDSVELRTYVLVNGVERGHVSWSVRRELSGALPDQVAAVSGGAPAAGTVVWYDGPDVADRPVHPFNASSGWLPKAGDRVRIYVTDGWTSWPQGWFLVDETTGDVDGGYQSTLVDDVDALSAPFSHDALLRVMPPLLEAGAYRSVGLTPIFYVNAAMRKAGFYSTPPNGTDPALSVPAQGSMWPEVGTVSAASNYEGAGSHHSNNVAPWGWSSGNFNCTYTPATTWSSTTRVQLSVCVAPDHAGNFFLTVYYGPSNTVSLAVTAGRAAILRINGTEACRVSLGSATTVSALVKEGVVTLRTSGGATATGAGTIGGGAMSSILTSGDASTRVAGILVGRPAQDWEEHAPVGHAPNAVLRLDRSTLIGLMDAGPAFTSEPVADVLDSISQATLSPYWFDENGVLVFTTTDALVAQSSSRTITTADDIFQLGWRDSLLGVRKSVVVEHEVPAIDKGRYRNREAWRGSGATVESGESKVEFASPSGDTDWIMVDDTFSDANADAGTFNTGRESWAGGVVTSDGKVTTWATPSQLAYWIEQVNTTTYKIYNGAGTLPAGSRLLLETPNEAANSTLWPRYRSHPLPVLRAFGIVEWATVTQPAITAGPVGPVLTHQVGKWANRETDWTIPDRIGSYIAARVTAPVPTIQQLEVAYDPRTQLGDVITIDSAAYMGVTMTALVVGVSNAADGDYTQSLSVRILSITTPDLTTYGEWEQKFPDTLTYGQWELLRGETDTYADFNNDPSKGA